jgi:hypothetical protein
VAGLSVAHVEVAALIVQIHEADLHRRAGRVRNPLRAVRAWIQTARTGVTRPT